MSLRVGCDIVSISLFQERLNASGDLLADRIFHPGEVAGASTERLAGLFAAKEAACKALNLPAGAWLEILIERDPRGAPMVAFLEPKPWIREISVSISHAGDYAIAMLAAVIE
jgi:phosphopantetheine--protein transferase-like protein